MQYYTCGLIFFWYPSVCSTLCLCTQWSSSTISVFAVMPATLLHTVNRLVFQYCNTIFVDLFFWYFSMCSTLCLCTDLSSAISVNVSVSVHDKSSGLSVLQYYTCVLTFSGIPVSIRVPLVVFCYFSMCGTMPVRKHINLLLFQYLRYNACQETH